MSHLKFTWSNVVDSWSNALWTQWIKNELRVTPLYGIFTGHQPEHTTPVIKLNTRRIVEENLLNVAKDSSTYSAQLNQGRTITHKKKTVSNSSTLPSFFFFYRWLTCAIYYSSCFFHSVSTVRNLKNIYMCITSQFRSWYLYTTI